ncbi:helix-turn-helix domain-containing protein [Nocardia sp. NRRL S-836]|uniref:helix-turn-helix domain-containing protein n=1 Tax=Nocardia sp. NRRL S-836 TaxID=1519492 RepID=UPI0007C8410D|nr:helix-turn-helix transcriptional regulator [Nocardia sp. NRRL S-836]
MDYDTPPNDVGRRVREIRNWRNQSLEVVAGLAGISFGHLGRIERGEKPLTTRSTMEALARALRVAPSEFDGRPWEVPGWPDPKAHAGLVAVEEALDSFELGEDPGVPTRPWPQVSADLDLLADRIQHADYAGQGELTPVLLGELHALYVREPQLRTPVLLGLVKAYSSAVWITKRIGGRGLSLLAAKAARQCALELGSPAWLGYTAWLRGDATGALSRPHQYQRAVRMVDELSPHLNDPEVVQSAGMLHLSAALAAAVQADRDTAATHIEEATALAGRMDLEVGTFGGLWFGVPNVGVWATTIGLELGDGAKVAETARGVRIAAIPSTSRHAEFYCEVGRALMGEPKQRDTGLQLVLTAEKLAPQRVRADVLVREAVAHQLRTARRDAGGRELRGLAWRLGIAPEFSPNG